MVSFERFFRRLKEVLGDPQMYDVWPEFSPECDEDEFLQAKIGEHNVLMLHCASCDGPLDPRHPTCKQCMIFRIRKAKERLYSNKKWVAVALFRLHPIESLEN